MNKDLIALFKVLAELYPGDEESALIMETVGVEVGRIYLQQGARTRWFAIVSECVKSGLIPALVNAALADYPHHEPLLAVGVALGIQEGVEQRLRVLAIWSSAPGYPALDQTGEANALYNVGLDYLDLRGTDATRDAVVREWLRLKPDIVQVGAHGEQGNILLSDGSTRVGWWLRLVKRHCPRLIMLLSCESSSSGMFDIPEAFTRAGVAAVIAVSDKILDSDAVLFARVFYENFTVPMPVAAAVEIAKLTVSDEAAQMIRLREAT